MSALSAVSFEVILSGTRPLFSVFSFSQRSTSPCDLLDLLLILHINIPSVYV